MKYINKELTDWAIQKIKRDYPGDVSLLIGHRHWKIEPDGDEVAFNYFIPVTERGYGLAKTFIVDNIGYDLFPMSWERVEGLANLDESLTTCLADGVILYAESDEARERFIGLQNKLQVNLKNSAFTYRKGLEKISIAMDLYKTMVFEESAAQVRKASGYIVGYLSQAVATLNGTYFIRGPENQIQAVSGMKRIPRQFPAFYQRIVEASTIPEIKDACFHIIAATRSFFQEEAPPADIKQKEYNFRELASWYEEGTYTFRRIYYYCDQKDVFNSFAWGYNFQQEFDSIQDEFGLQAMDLMGVFNPENLDAFRKRAEAIEQYIVTEIKRHGVSIREYASLEEFLIENG